LSGVGATVFGSTAFGSIGAAGAVFGGDATAAGAGSTTAGTGCGSDGRRGAVAEIVRGGDGGATVPVPERK
jgi:hypothetical protein